MLKSHRKKSQSIGFARFKIKKLMDRKWMRVHILRKLYFHKIIIIVIDTVAERYRAVYAEVRAKGAQLTSSGGKRDLSAAVSTGRSATSFHYTGRAASAPGPTSKAEARSSVPNGGTSKMKPE